MELAIVTPLLIVLLLGTVDVGRIIFSYIALEDAVQDGVTYAAWNPSDTSGIKGRVTTSSNHGEVVAASFPPGPFPCTTPNPSASPPAPGTVSVTAGSRVELITPVGRQLFGGSFPISSTLTGTNLKGTC